MRLGIFSDAHGNLPATEACIRELRSRGADRLAFLGDAVGYLGRSRDTMALVESAADVCLIGNHEAYAAGLARYPAEHEPVYRTREVARDLGPESLGRIAHRAPSQVLPSPRGDVLLVHGSPWDPLSGYVYPDADLSPFAGLPFAAVAMGHTHRPFVARSGGVLVVNCGSCGLPRDRGDLGACAILDTDTLEAELIRFPVDARATLDGDPGAHESVVRLFSRRPAADPGGST